MLIGIDANEANEVRADIGERVGVNNYAFEILWGLYKGNKKDKKHSFYIFLKNKPLKDLPRQNSWWTYKIIPGARLWIMTKLMPHLFRKRNRPDVLFSPSHYLPPLLLIPSVCVIHDLGYLKFSEQFKKYDFWQLKLWSAISIIISKCIISVSENTKKDIVRHYHFASKKIVVIPHGYDKGRFNDSVGDDVVRRVKNKYSINGNYILYLGTLKPSKNIEGIIDAFYRLSNRHNEIPVKLVIAGKKGWLFDGIFEKVRSYELDQKVVFTDFVKEIDKPGLIKGAKLLVSPSFWEGFGMHILESLACGTPVVVSKLASMPEVSGSAGRYVNPDSVESIYSAIYDVLTMNKVEYNKLVEMSIKEAEKFSWTTTSQKTIKVLENAGK